MSTRPAETVAPTMPVRYRDAATGEVLIPRPARLPAFEVAA